jgi:hypothetical protein
MENNIPVVAWYSIAWHDHSDFVGNGEVVTALITVGHYLQGHRSILDVSSRHQHLMCLSKYWCVTMELRQKVLEQSHCVLAKIPVTIHSKAKGGMWIMYIQLSVGRGVVIGR